MSGEILYGKNSVREALKNGTQIDKLFVLQGSRERTVKEIIFLAKKQGIVIKECSKLKLDEMCEHLGFEGKGGNHQGVVATVPAFEYSEIDDIFDLAEKKGEKPFAVILDSIQDPQNLGAIIRSAEVLGAHGVIIGKRRSATLNTAAFKVSCGAAQYIPVVKVTNLNSAIAELKERGMWIISADMDGQPLSKSDLTGSVALVIGGENDGVSRLVKENSDMVVKIEMGGKVNSLNASCAASILMYEKRRQDIIKK